MTGERDSGGSFHGAVDAMRHAVRAVPPVLIATVLGVALVAVAWVAVEANVPGPAVPVQRALELRRARSRDASAYAEVFSDTSVARTLASDAAASTGSPVPDWETPYVSRQETSGADVVVLWRRDGDHSDWPRANVFRVRLVKGSWRIVDASAVASAAPLPAPAR